jgi:hypothetical protein
MSDGTYALGFVEILQAHEYLVPPQTTLFRDFLECLQYKRVGWIMMVKISVKVGTKASKTAEIQQSARLEEGNGMLGGCNGECRGKHKGGEMNVDWD